jgi:hypothetical protein
MSRHPARPGQGEGHPGLELEDDMRFQHRLWRIERLGWVLMGLLVVAAAAILGPGPLARTQASGGRLLVEYDRVARLHTATEIDLRTGPGTTELRLTGSLLRDAEVHDSFDAPLRAAPDGALLLDAMGETRLVLTPRGVGLHDLRAELGTTGESVDLTLLVLP